MSSVLRALSLTSVIYVPEEGDGYCPFSKSDEGGNEMIQQTVGVRAHSLRIGVLYRLPLTALSAAEKKLDRNALTTESGELTVVRRPGYGFVVIDAPIAFDYLTETKSLPRPQQGSMPKHTLTLTRGRNQ